MPSSTQPCSTCLAAPRWPNMAKKPQSQKATSNGHDRAFATNRQAFFDYNVLEALEAGIELTGTEVKSIRAGNVNLRDAYARLKDGEVRLWNAYIAPFDQGNRWNHEPRRPRRLLLHTREIGRLGRGVNQAG